MSIEAIIDGKGRVCIPAEIRKKLGLQPGEKVSFEVQEEKLIVRKTVTPREFRKTAEKLRAAISEVRTKPLEFEKLFE